MHIISYVLIICGRSIFNISYLIVHTAYGTELSVELNLHYCNQYAFIVCTCSKIINNCQISDYMITCMHALQIYDCSIRIFNINFHNNYWVSFVNENFYRIVQYNAAHEYMFCDQM